jgi:hypothetical protein
MAKALSNFSNQIIQSCDDPLEAGDLVVRHVCPFEAIAAPRGVPHFARLEGPQLGYLVFPLTFYEGKKICPDLSIIGHRGALRQSCGT